MTDSKEEIKRRLPIAEVISGYVKLQKAGSNYKALCPFHNEKTPSFTVSPDKDMWYCFGCGEGGDVFSFVQKIEGVEFVDALRSLAEKAGVELKPQDKEISSKRKKLLQINELASRFFKKQLESNSGKKVVSYLKERGVNDDSLEKWAIGYAPDDWGSLYTFLSTNGYSKEDIESTGLTIKSEKPARSRTHHDRFRHRIMFPIMDLSGNVVGFSGRLFESVPSKTTTADSGKYINTPQTQLYDKSRLLYGLNFAKSDIKKKDNCLLVEGNIDVILAQQAGETNSVAPCGTAVGSGHFELIKRFSPNLTFCFDADSAGVNATAKSAKIALSHGLNVSVVTLPKGKDVADVISQDIKEWEAQLLKPISYIEFIIKTAKEKFPPKSAQNKKNYIHEVLSTVRSVSSPVEQAHWLQELAQDVGMEEQVLREEMRSLPEEEIIEEAATDAIQQEGEAQAVEQYIVALMFKNPAHVLENYKEEQIETLFENERMCGIVLKLLKGVSPKDIASKDETTRPLLFASEVIDIIIDEKSIPKEIDRIIVFLKKRNVSKKLKEIQTKLQKAEKDGDTALATKLLNEFSHLSKELMETEQKPKEKLKITR